MSDIEIGSEWIWTNADGEVVVEVIDVATNEHGETIVTTEEDDGEIQYDDIDYFLANYKPKTDMVNHPPHYKDASGIECCQVTDLMMFNAASCFKYLYRCGNKWDDIEDLKKAVWYAKRAYLTGDNEQPNSLEWDNNIKAIASYREHGIYKAMTAIRSYSWLAVAAFIGDEITRLESEVEK